MTSPVSFKPDQRHALLESLEKLCSIFWGPDLEKCSEMSADNYFLSFEILKNLLDDHYMDTIQNIKKIVLDFSDTESFFNFLEETYVRLFINTRGGISAPLYHSCYLDGGQTDASPAIMGETAVLMTQRFESKGLSIADTISEPPDHLSIEIEYLFFLLQNGWGKQNNDYLAEAASFAESFMMPWISQFCNRLSGEQNYPFYSHAAAILKFELSLISQLGKGNAV